jgi:predicted nuclease of predicted toxin-antitoxin system
VDVQTCQEAGLLGKADEVHFEHAFAEKRAIITNDNDFLKLAAKQTEHYGIVFIVNQRTDIGVIVKRIVQLHHIVEAERFRNQIEYI